jgi:phenylpropionate dioxygenase-like ring-hydroxylating dioxygenase large terminal subunit
MANANYELYTDNILDLSHAEFIHPALAAPAFLTGKRKARQEGDTVWYHVSHPNDYLSVVLGAAFDVEGKRQHFWTDVRWNAAAAMALTAQCAEPGAGRETAKSPPSMHFLTPETATRSHYFWAVARETRMSDAAFTEAMRAGFIDAFEQEDGPTIAR